jgi:hypothetical protein
MIPEETLTDRDEFPYELLLAFYRGRLRDPAERAEVEQLLAESPRWQAHWKSVQHLDLKRESAQRDGELLNSFLDGPVPQMCEIIAESGGQIFDQLLSDRPPEQVAGFDLEAWRELDATNAYARCMRRRADSDRLRRRAGLSPDEELLGDWLLAHYYRPALEHVTQSLALRRALRRSEEIGLEEEAPGPDILAFDRRLFDRLEQALAQPAAQRQDAIRDAVYLSDPLCAVAAGEAETIIRARPVWFTSLLAPPAEITWSDEHSRGPWRVRVLDVKATVLLQAATNEPHVKISDDVQASIPRDEDVRWEVRSESSPDRVHVCGVFRVLDEERARRLTTRLRELASATPGVARDLMIAQVQHQSGLYDAAAEHLERLCHEHRAGGGAFLVRRALASTYLAVRRELTGPRNLGHREGLWATKFANEALESAYKMLGIKFEFEE